MTTLPLERLLPHPGNTNRMPEAMLRKLIAHIEGSGRYPPLIVRAHPSREGSYEILDGHHRAEALRRLGHAEARCDVWPADDEQAAVLLLTLNRLQGQDDPRRRGALLERLARSTPIEALAKLVPEHRARLQRLIDLNHPPQPLASPAELARMPLAVTFFLSAAQRTRLLDRLASICPDRSEALARLLELDGETPNEMARESEGQTIARNA